MPARSAFRPILAGFSRLDGYSGTVVFLSKADWRTAQKFKDFMHGQTPISIGDLEVCPPEDPKIFFEVDEQTDYSTIENFNGDFVKDIVENCREDLRTRMRSS
jgi:hypothetical protein